MLKIVEINNIGICKYALEYSSPTMKYLNTKGINAIIPIIREINILNDSLIILDINISLSLSLIASEADSDHVKLKMLNKVIQIVENLLAAE